MTCDTVSSNHVPTQLITENAFHFLNQVLLFIPMCKGLTTGLHRLNYILNEKCSSRWSLLQTMIMARASHPPYFKNYNDEFSQDFVRCPIYSCSLGHIWEHEFCHLGWWAVKGKFLKQPNFCLNMLLFGVVFHVFMSKYLILIFFYIVASSLKSCIKWSCFFSF